MTPSLPSSGAAFPARTERAEPQVGSAKRKASAAAEAEPSLWTGPCRPEKKTRNKKEMTLDVLATAFRNSRGSFPKVGGFHLWLTSLS